MIDAIVPSIFNFILPNATMASVLYAVPCSLCLILCVVFYVRANLRPGYGALSELSATSAHSGRDQHNAAASAIIENDNGIEMSVMYNNPHLTIENGSYLHQVDEIEDDDKKSAGDEAPYCKKIFGQQKCS